MVLEATVICLDNTEWMRNGDFLPTRIEAQQDAVNLICAAKTQQNPESTVAVMTMAHSKNGTHSEVLVTLTQDLGKILSSIHSVKIGGDGNFSSAMQVAQLVLKHRQNKNQHQRIVSFVGSPIKESADDLVKLARRLKKNNIAVDIINFGEETQNVEKLEAFQAAVNNPSEESHILNVPPGPHILSDLILNSPIVVGEGGGGGFGAAAAASAAAAAAAASGATGGEFDFGVDPTLDPELAMVLRISMEEEQARQQAQTDKGAEGPKQEGGASATTSATPAAAPADTSGDVEMADFDEEMKAAMRMSMGGHMTEDEQIQLALQMSQAPPTSATPAATPTPAPAPTTAPAVAPSTPSLQDPSFLDSVLRSLPGVDPNDERIRGILSSMGEQKEEKKDDKDKKDGK